VNRRTFGGGKIRPTRGAYRGGRRESDCFRGTRGGSGEAWGAGPGGPGGGRRGGQGGAGRGGREGGGGGWGARGKAQKMITVPSKKQETARKHEKKNDQACVNAPGFLLELSCQKTKPPCTCDHSQAIKPFSAFPPRR